MGKYENIPYTTNLPDDFNPADVITSMEPACQRALAHATLNVVKRAMRDPSVRDAINAKVAELRAEGFYDRYPAKV